jgi:hypothetical protein
MQQNRKWGVSLTFIAEMNVDRVNELVKLIGLWKGVLFRTAQARIRRKTSDSTIVAANPMSGSY